MHLIQTPKRAIQFLREVRRVPAPRLAYISGWLGHENLGDEVLPEAMERLFAPFSLVPFRGERSAGCVNLVSRAIGAGVLAGGTVINSGAGFFIHMRQSLDFLPSTFVFGSGVRDPEFWSRQPDWRDTRGQWVGVLQNCAFVGVRGPLSARLLREVGVSAEVVGDPALAYFDENATIHRDDSEVSLGLNIGHSKGRVWGSEEHILREYTALAVKARRAGWRVRWFVVWPEDLAVTQRAAEDSGTADDIVCEYKSAARYLQMAQEMTFFVGMKLHAVVLAMCAQTPCIMVEYRPKCRDFMQSINQEDASIRSNQFQGAETFEMLQDWSDTIDQRRLELHQDVSSMAKKQRQKAQEITARILSGKA